MKQFLTSKDISKWILCVLLIAFIFGLSACTSKPMQPAEVPAAADESDDKGSERRKYMTRRTEAMIQAMEHKKSMSRLTEAMTQAAERRKNRMQRSLMPPGRCLGR